MNLPNKMFSSKRVNNDDQNSVGSNDSSSSDVTIKHSDEEHDCNFFPPITIENAETYLEETAQLCKEDKALLAVAKKMLESDRKRFNISSKSKPGKKRKKHKPGKKTKKVEKQRYSTTTDTNEWASTISNQDKVSTTSTDKETLIDRLQELECEKSHLEAHINQTVKDREDADKAAKRAKGDLEVERQRYEEMNKPVQPLKPAVLPTVEQKTQEKKNPPSVESKSRKSSVSSAISSIPAAVKQPSREAPKVERKKPQIRGMQSDKQELFDLTIDSSIMRDKLDRMHAISSENLLLQSDVADYHAELVELRNEAKELRAKCHELVEDNRINKQEVRDLRRYIDLQKANKNGDTQQDLLNKIEYYQMEHDQLLDEVRRLKNRLGDLSPRRSRETSPKSMKNTPREKSGAVSKSRSRSRSRSPVADAIAAST